MKDAFIITELNKVLILKFTPMISSYSPNANIFLTLELSEEGLTCLKGFRFVKDKLYPGVAGEITLLHTVFFPRFLFALAPLGLYVEVR